jgi:hypothetical protein
MTTAEFKSASGRAQWTMLLLGLAVVLDLIAVPSDLMEYAIMSRIDAGEFISDEEAIANDTRQMVIGLGQVGLIVVCAIAYLIWLYRAHANLPALGATGLKFSPGWAVGWWFVPLANLIQPYRVVAEVWRESVPGAREGGSVPPLVAVWWGAFLIANMLSGQAGRLYGDSTEAAKLMTADVLFAVSDGLSAVAAVLAIMVVRAIDRGQQGRAPA